MMLASVIPTLASFKGFTIFSVSTSPYSWQSFCVVVFLKKKI